MGLAKSGLIVLFFAFVVLCIGSADGQAQTFSLKVCNTSKVSASVAISISWPSATAGSRSRVGGLSLRVIATRLVTSPKGGSTFMPSRPIRGRKFGRAIYRENWGLADLEPTEMVPHAESCARGKRREIEVPETLVPVAFRNPREAHQALSALARERFGPDARIGQNVSLSFSSKVIAIPHKSMWYGPKDHVVLKSIEDLLDRLQSYSPEALQKHLGYLDREYMGKYLRQNSIRVARLIDKLEAMGLRPGSRLFEIGALFGSFALPLARLGYRVTAIDRYKAFDGALAAYVDLMQSEGIEVVSVTRETETEAIGRLPAFDCTIAMAVIEHIPHTPRHFLEMMRDKTVPGGIIALDTPNVTRFWNRRRLSQDESTFQDLSLQYECEIPYEGHHREYTAQEMHWLLNRIGCEEVSIDLFDYNMLQFEQIDGPHLECLSLILSDLAYADTILACGRRP